MVCITSTAKLCVFSETMLNYDIAFVFAGLKTNSTSLAAQSLKESESETHSHFSPVGP